MTRHFGQCSRPWRRAEGSRRQGERRERVGRTAAADSVPCGCWARPPSAARRWLPWRCRPAATRVSTAQLAATGVPVRPRGGRGSQWPLVQPPLRSGGCRPRLLVPSASDAYRPASGSSTSSSSTRLLPLRCSAIAQPRRATARRRPKVSAQHAWRTDGCMRGPAAGQLDTGNGSQLRAATSRQGCITHLIETPCPSATGSTPTNMRGTPMDSGSSGIQVIARARTCVLE